MDSSEWNLINNGAVESLDLVSMTFVEILVLIVVGVALIWFVSFFSEGALQKLRPVVIFLVIAAFVGFLTLNSFG